MLLNNITGPGMDLSYVVFVLRVAACCCVLLRVAACCCVLLRVAAWLLSRNI